MYELSRFWAYYGAQLSVFVGGLYDRIRSRAVRIRALAVCTRLFNSAHLHLQHLPRRFLVRLDAPFALKRVQPILLFQHDLTQNGFFFRAACQLRRQVRI